MGQQQRQQIDLPVSYWPLLLKKGYLANLASAHSWQSATEANADFKRLLTDFLGKLQQLQRQVQDREHSVALANPTEIYRDLDALCDEFSEIDYDIKTHQLKVTTDPITLEDVELGSFQIVLEWHLLGQSQCYHITACNPNPAASDRDMLHPHINREILCEGDGAVPIKQALEQGRILDFFILVKQILTTYNPASAYLAIERWYGSPCQSCSTLTDENDLSICPMCSEGVCRDCSSGCNSCCESCCSSCLILCTHCENSFCSHCMSNCDLCCATCCEGCLTDGICPNCEQTTEEEDEEPEEPTDATVHSVCMGEVTLSP